MTPRNAPMTQTAFRIEPEILDGLKEVKDRQGIPISEQVRRALVMWLSTWKIEVSTKRTTTQRLSRRTARK